MQTQSNQLPPLFLASTSPRRRQLLEALGLSFTLVHCDINEKHPEIGDLSAVISENAVGKALAGAKALGDKKGLVISADTLVAVENKVLTKPVDRADAVEMLKLLSGRKHTVMTGVALQLSTQAVHSFVETSEVFFRKLSPIEIESYADTREPYDKAGAYAVQGASCLFIEKIVGSYTNVMGLPIERLLREIESYTGISVFKWFAPK